MWPGEEQGSIDGESRTSWPGAQEHGELDACEKDRACLRRSRSLYSFSVGPSGRQFCFGVRRVRRCFTCGVVIGSMAMAVGIHKIGERLPTTELICPNANSDVGFGRCDVGICRCNTPSSSCHLSCECKRPSLSAASFVGECLSDTSFTSVDTCVGAYTHQARAHARWHDCSCMLSLSPFVAQG